VATRSNLHLDMCANAHTAAFDAVVSTMYRLISLAVIIVWIIVWIAGLVLIPLYARDDGRFTNSPLKEWFDRLKSPIGCPTDQFPSGGREAATSPASVAIKGRHSVHARASSANQIWRSD
jgi:hypothetical protein